MSCCSTEVAGNQSIQTRVPSPFLPFQHLNPRPSAWMYNLLLVMTSEMEFLNAVSSIVMPNFPPQFSLLLLKRLSIALSFLNLLLQPLCMNFLSPRGMQYAHDVRTPTSIHRVDLKHLCCSRVLLLSMN